MRPRTRVPCILTFALLLVLLAGCGRQASFTASVSPDRGPAATLDARTGAQVPPDQLQGNSGFFPLTIGNHWRYATSFEIISTAGELPDDNPMLGHKDARLVRTQTIGGRDYVVEEDVITDFAGTHEPQHIYWRQDRTGLYEADVPVGLVADDRGGVAAAVTRALSRVKEPDASPAALAAWSAARRNLERKLALVARLARGARPADGAADPDVPAELTRLLYPLHPGASWDIRTDPLFTSRVEGMDVLTTAAGRYNGWRMRYDSQLFGANDVVHVWYGDAGYLGLKAHLEGVVTDQYGGVVGTIVVEQSELLDAIELVKPDRADH